MFDPKSAPSESPLASTAAAHAGSAPAGRVMRIAPLDLRQPEGEVLLRPPRQGDVTRG